MNLCCFQTLLRHARTILHIVVIGLSLRRRRPRHVVRRRRVRSSWLPLRFWGLGNGRSCICICRTGRPRRPRFPGRESRACRGWSCGLAVLFRRVLFLLSFGGDHDMLIVDQHGLARSPSPPPDRPPRPPPSSLDRAAPPSSQATTWRARCGRLCTERM